MITLRSLAERIREFAIDRPLFLIVEEPDAAELVAAEFFGFELFVVAILVLAIRGSL